MPSAPGRRFDGDDKVTDLLYRCYQQVEKGEDCAETFAKIEERYLGIARELGLTMDVRALLRTHAPPSSACARRTLPPAAANT